MGSPVPAALRQADGDPGPFTGPCAFCGGAAGEDDFCNGCKLLVCRHCDQRPEVTELYGPHRPSIHGALERRKVAQEVARGRAAMKAGRIEEVCGALNSIEALLRL